MQASHGQHRARAKGSQEDKPGRLSNMERDGKGTYLCWSLASRQAPEWGESALASRAEVHLDALRLRGGLHDIQAGKHKDATWIAGSYTCN